ncbi:helix-turn-helix transcriptional regulator [Sporolituus thermophilus]|uniref:helix-turn-helix transcriptional regulator n=1 Tax=Sporolituus thermophilus TaxID=608505 RepID=UPI000B88AE97|nr:helix-turn-helix transcriptional regulator [Sporolituus thermophilus]
MRHWLIQLRKKSGLSQKQVAIQASISQNHYCNIETGFRNPSIAVAKRIANALNFHWTAFYDIKD